MPLPDCDRQFPVLISHRHNLWRPHLSELSHRERVARAFNHQEPDRIPIDLMGNASMLLDETYMRLRDHLGLPPIPPVRSGSTANYYDERILERFDVDFRRIFLKKAAGNSATHHEDGSFSDAWGVRWLVRGPFVNAVGHPLTAADSVAAVEAYDWPRAIDLFTTEGLAAEAGRKFTETDYALVARNPTSGGFLEQANNLMGMENFLITLSIAPAVAHSIIDHLLDIYKGIYGMFLDAVGPFVQMVEVSDDLGSQESLLISPKMYREFIKPAERELYALIHAKAPKAALFHHTDGAVFDILPDLCEVGVNVLNPVQTSVWGMAAPKLKAAFGSRLIFHGAVEQVEGDVTPRQVAAHVRDRIDNLAAGGGYVLAPCNHMIDVRPEIIVTMYETAREYGRYDK